MTAVMLKIFVLNFVVYQSLSHSTAGDHPDVLILGGGVAGMFAAAKLEQNGVSYMILEGSDRIGGRIKSTTLGNYTVELGPVWMHGPANPLLSLADQYGMPYQENTYSWYVTDEMGNNMTDLADELFEEYERASVHMYEYAELLRDNDWPDMDISAGLAMFGFTAQTPVESSIEGFEIDFEMGEPGESTGLKHETSKKIVYANGDGDYIVTEQENGGFIHLVKSYAEEHIPDWETKIQFDTMVTGVEYTNDGVTVHTSQGEYTAKYAIMTFSIGVLQKEVINFDPPLPTWKRQSIFGFHMVDYYHFYLRFPEDEPWFVPDVEFTLYSSDTKGYYPTWQNFEVYHPGCRILQGAIMHDQANRFHTLTDEEVLSEVMAVLRTMFGDAIPDPEEMVRPDWIHDPLTYGAFTNWPPGYTAAQYKSLQAPMGRLHFAGEAYSTDYYGYVQGAIDSGEHVADKVTRCLNTVPGSAQYAGCVSFVPSYRARGCTYKLAGNYDRAAQEDDGSCTLLSEYVPSHAHRHAASALTIALWFFVFKLFC